MAESNEPGDRMKIFAQKAIQRETTEIEGSSIFIVVHDDEQQLENFKKIATKNTDSARKIFVFNDVDTFYDFVIEKVSSNLRQIVVFVGGQLVNDVVSSIHYCEQVQLILIMNKPPFSDEERESMKMYSKVKYMADHSSDKLEHDLGQQPDVKEIQRTRFDEPISFDYVPNEESNEDSFSDTEPIERSYKQLDGNLLLRFLMIMSLRNAQPFSSGSSDLIKLFETEYHISSKDIDRFKETYSSSKAIVFYSRDQFIYGKLNSALRTSNIDHLLSFQFIFQDICNQLYETMTRTADNQILTVYRGQIANSFEVADLFIAYCNKSFVMNTSFLSTSKDKEFALFFLSAADHTPFDLNHSPVLFRITARKQDQSFYFPFADISEISDHRPEREVLFAPGRIFNIDNFDIIWENHTNIFLFEMSLNDKFNETHTTLKPLIDMKNPWFFVGKMLTDNKRFHEAKELYMRLLSEYGDKEEKYRCYQGLYGIAMAQDDQIEMQNIDRKMTEIRFGFVPPDRYSNCESMSREDSAEYFAGFEHIKKMHSSISPTRPINESLSFMQSDEFRTGAKQLLDSSYPLAKILIKSGVYDQAIIILEKLLQYRNIFPNMSLDSLDVARCYMQLGHCYRELKLNDKALNNYNSALEQSIHLPLDEQVETLLGLGKTLEDMNNHRDALDRYIEVAEIYNNNSIVADAEQRRNLEETIQKVLSHCIPIDDNCKMS